MKKQTYNANSLKKYNEEAIRNALLHEDSLTISAIARLTGLSVATCGNILNELMARREALEVDREASTGGRRARKFKINEMYKMIMGMAVRTEAGVHSIQITIANWKGKVIHSDSNIYEQIDDFTIVELVNKYINTYPTIRAIGIGVPGIVTDGTVRNCDLKELDDIPLKEKLESQYENVVVTVENDMHFAVYGFYELPKTEDPQTIAMVSFNQGNYPGASFIIDGQITKGSTNFSGEVSYLPLEKSREEQLEKLQHPETATDIVVKIITSIISIINPEFIVLTGKVSKGMFAEDLYDKCLTYIPKEHMAELVVLDDIKSSYQRGLITITLDSLRLAPLLNS